MFSPIHRYHIGSTLVYGIVTAAISPNCLSADELSERCVVSVLNRTVNVKTDGTWILPNIPANFGRVRARATCVENGVTRSGQSDFFTIPANGSVDVPRIVLGPVTPVPQQVTVTAPSTSLNRSGQSVQLTVNGRYPDANGGTRTADISRASTGTTYRISNPDLASITVDGFVTAKASGTVLVQAQNEGTQGIIQINVALAGDTDNDGIPDDVEIRLGLDPRNPADAFDDPDRDGLTNREEVTLGTDIRKADSDGDGISDGDEVKLYRTNPLLADTDGDGVPDRVEVNSGSDPTNSNSVNLAGALRRISVIPTTFAINLNSIQGEGFQQLTVTGEFTLGGTIDLTRRSRGTNYQSSNVQVCNFGAEDCRVFGSQDGSCTITITNNGFTATVAGTVRNFTPTALGGIDIPGYANNVDASGAFAYVAAGAVGMVVVNIADPRAMRIVSTIDTPGNANDIRVVGNLAYIADGDQGLRIFNVSNPAVPVLMGAVDTAGDASDVVVFGSRAYLAIGEAGLAVVDVSNPSAPVLLAQVDTPGIARGVDVLVSGGSVYAVIADDSPSPGLRVINVTTPTSASVVGGITLAGSPKDVKVSGTLGYVAVLGSGLAIVDLSNPLSPIASGTLVNQFSPRDVEVVDRFALFARQAFPNGVSIVDVSSPSTPLFRAVLDLSRFGEYSATGIAVSGPYVLTTGQLNTVTVENGVVGTTKLFIGQFRANEDRAGVPPTVNITSPGNGSSVIRGSTVTVSANAVDDIGIASVTFTVNGAVASVDTSPPFETALLVPTNATSLNVAAQAVDFGGNVANSGTISLTAIADPLTTVSGVVLDEQQRPVPNAQLITTGGLTGTSGADGRFSIQRVPTILGTISVTASITPQGGSPLSGNSQPALPVLGGTTNAGTIIVTAAQFDPVFGQPVRLCDDCFYTYTLPFEFPFYGLRHTTAHVGTNGYVTFSEGDGEYSETVFEFARLPRVAAFFDDLQNLSGGATYVKVLQDRIVVTYDRVAHYPAGGSNTVQIQLYSDGRIVMAYGQVTSRDLGAIVGISSGSGTQLQTIDFSATRNLVLPAGVSLYEYFAAANLFDLDRGFIVFTPVPGGGYTVRTLLPLP